MSFSPRKKARVSLATVPSIQIRGTSVEFPRGGVKSKNMKIFVPQTSFHHVFEPLPDGIELVNEPEAPVEMAVLGMEQAAYLPSLIPALPHLRVVQSLNSGIEAFRNGLPKIRVIFRD